MSSLKVMKPHPEMIEGPEAWKRFRAAVKAVLTVKKSDMPPSPFGKSGKKRKGTVSPKRDKIAVRGK
jgi:hypothetical protein